MNATRRNIENTIKKRPVVLMVLGSFRKSEMALDLPLLFAFFLEVGLSLLSLLFFSFFLNRAMVRSGMTSG